jgi:integrase
MRKRGQIIPRKTGFTVRVFTGRKSNGERIIQNQRVTGTKKDAQKVLTAMLRKLDTGELLLNPSKHTVEEYCEYWLENVAKHSIGRSTFKNYCHYLRHKIYPKLGETKLTRVDSTDIQAIYNDLTKRGLSSRTVHYTHVVFSKALKHAVAQRLIPSNPCDHVQKPKHDRKEMNAMTEQEVQGFLLAAQENRLYAYFALLLATGLRPAEGLALRWQDFDPLNKTLVIVRTLEYVSGKVYFKEPKTSRSRRTIQLHDETVKLLLDRRPSNVSDNDLIFASETGTPLSTSNVLNRYFKPCLLKAGLATTEPTAKGSRIVSRFRLYDLRHTHATMLLKANVNPKVVSERLGHSGIALTLDTYSHVLPTIQKAAVEALGNVLYSNDTAQKSKAMN